MALVGCHVSISGGVELAPARGRALVCEVMQIFTSNQMQWRGAAISEESRRGFVEEVRKCGIRAAVSHDSYLINLGSPDAVKLEKSRTAFAEEVDRCEMLGIGLLVFHPGSHMGEGADLALKTIAESLDRVIESRSEAKLTFLLEITAGQGSNVGHTLEHLRDIIAQCRYPDRLGICFDTCHAFAAGYDLRTPEQYEAIFENFDAILGLDRLRVFHLNDSKKEPGSHVDRHHILGEGYIGREVFERLVRDERFANLPMILETPGGDENFAREIAMLKEARERR